jgi:ribosomal-protein-alanine N-acetyltransferase
MMPPGSITIRPILKNNIDLVAEIYGACFDEPWPRPAVEELLATPGAWGLIANVAASDGDIAAGFILARVVVDETDILSVGVHPQRQRNGIGRILVEAVIQAAETAGGEAVTLEVAEDNSGARALYASFGFAVVGRRPGYYLRVGNVKVAALLMRYSIER